MSLINIAQDYKQYEKSSIMKTLAAHAHGKNYIGQTSSATFEEVCELIQKLGLPPKARILDAGCGNGAFALLLAQKFGFQVTGIDLSEDIIKIAQRQTYEFNLNDLCHFFVGDFSDFVTSQPFDLILCIGSLYWNQPLAQTFQRWHQALNNPGWLVLFLNLAEEVLTLEETKAIDQTSFILIETIKHELTSANFKLMEWRDQTKVYSHWLEKWCHSMSLNQETIFQEMGQEKGSKMIHRFYHYLQLARSQKVKRIITLNKKNKNL